MITPLGLLMQRILLEVFRQFGPEEAAPVVTGMDVAVFERGRIRALYTFIDEAPSG